MEQTMETLHAELQRAAVHNTIPPEHRGDGRHAIVETDLLMRAADALAERDEKLGGLIDAVLELNAVLRDAEQVTAWASSVATYSEWRETMERLRFARQKAFSRATALAPKQEDARG